MHYSHVQRRLLVHGAWEGIEIVNHMHQHKLALTKGAEQASDGRLIHGNATTLTVLL